MKALCFALALVFVVPVASALSAEAPPDVCFSARVRATLPTGETAILESTPVAKSMEESNQLGLQYCAQQYPKAQCEVAGHSIVDCE